MLSKPDAKRVQDRLSNERPALVAVSGGSDSVALLHWLVDEYPGANLHCATVDHGLRPEAADEARWVGQLAQQLGLPHQTLTWTPPASATSADAREARYRLLHQLALNIGAQVIVLGHNLDDQAETVFMRALRLRQDSDTRGLSGIPPWSSYHGIDLWRPLLDRTRQDLRDDLVQRSVTWIDDPSNQDLNYERVRVRQLLNNQNGNSVPSKQQLARLANLSGRMRVWINQYAAACLKRQVKATADGAFLFAVDPGQPRLIAQGVLSILILAGGGQNYRPPSAKLIAIVEAALNKAPLRTTLGRCLVRSKDGRIAVERENRNLPERPSRLEKETLYDGRWLLKPAPHHEEPERTPYVEALETFRPCYDDGLHAALMELLDSPCRST
ncbi:MAG: tRNA lysidine(34) synthetase TilS [Hyphomicrobiales bacterium]|nr:tRNA lysidine(34) synthetase TilS [Hyphomicrobiales bacterium]